NFSFNSPYGACPTCDGLGTRLEVDSELIVPNDELSIEEGAIAPWAAARLEYWHRLLEAVAKAHRVSTKTPWKRLPKEARGAVKAAVTFLDQLELTDREHMIAERILKEIRARLQFLIDVGLDYLTLDRTSGTLAGGEAQRIRLATQIGSGLVGVLYILDEPSI